MLLIDREHNGDILLMNREHNSDVLLIDRAPAHWKMMLNVHLSQSFTKLVKKPSNLTRTGKEKSHRPISHSLAHFVEPIRRPCFRFAEGLTSGFTDGLAIGRAESRGGEVAVGFSG